MQLQSADVVVASDGVREQPVVLLMKTHLKSSMQAFLAAGERKIDHWYQQHIYGVTKFDDQPDAFSNINTPEQKQQFEANVSK